MHRILLLLLTVFTLLVPMYEAMAAQTVVTDVRWVTRNDAPVSYVRTVLELTAPVNVEAEISKDGLTTNVVLKNTVMKKAQEPITMNPKIVKSATFAQEANNLVMTVKTPHPIDTKDLKVFFLKANKELKTPPRLVVDVKQKNVKPRSHYFGMVAPEKKATDKDKAKDTLKDKKEISKDKKDPKKSKDKKEKKMIKAHFRVGGGLKDKVIVVDPGHGGSDVGAEGADGTYEKDLTLPISKKLQALLEKKGAKVIMSRVDDRDVFGPGASDIEELQARTDVGNENKADALISVHINSFTNPAVGGIADYYYDKTKYDRKFAQSIQKYTAKVPGFGADRGTQPAGFYILKKSYMPATLLELGFISNPKEVKLLQKESIQEEFAKAIVKGLEDYFEGPLQTETIEVEA